LSQRFGCWDRECLEAQIDAELERTDGQAARVPEWGSMVAGRARYGGIFAAFGVITSKNKLLDAAQFSFKSLAPTQNRAFRPVCVLFCPLFQSKCARRGKCASSALASALIITSVFGAIVVGGYLGI
jgi:hypothetical protein